jgi:transcriptional/translational regulatory protein YebC/TACO1
VLCCDFRGRVSQDKARVANVTKDVVENAIRRAVEGKDATVLETVLYEGSSAGGISFMVECLTDKRTRTGPAMRHIFTKYGGDLGGSGSVSWQFEQRGLVVVEMRASGDAGGGGAAGGSGSGAGGSSGGSSAVTEDDVMTAAIDAGAADVEFDDDEGVALVDCPSQETHAVRRALEAASLRVRTAEVRWVPKTTMEVPESNDTFARMLDALEDNDDVQNVWHNAT